MPPRLQRFPRTDGERIAYALLLMLVLAALFIGTVVGLGPVLGAGPARWLAIVLAVLGLGLGLRRGGATRVNLGLADVVWGRELARAARATLVVGLALVLLLALGSGPEAIVSAILEPSLGERLGFAAIGIGAAALEEPLFRGYLQPTAMRRFRNGPGLAAVAVLFALVHGKALTWPPFALLGKLSIGLGLGVLRGRDRSARRPDDHPRRDLGPVRRGSIRRPPSSRTSRTALDSKIVASSIQAARPGGRLRPLSLRPRPLELGTLPALATPEQTVGQPAAVADPPASLRGRGGGVGSESAAPVPRLGPAPKAHRHRVRFPDRYRAIADGTASD